ncbi:MAG: YeeE/YedE thiosulfate transporter family protein [Enterobacterales bacterium]|nr:YeeE/YedE thiosulfate transporter family protein [Enterobacterales bacterium]
MSEPFLPWWITAIALAVLTLGFYLLLKRPLGVSGSWARVVEWKNDQRLNEEEAPFLNQPKLFADALMAATITEFGEAEVARFMESRHKNKPKVDLKSVTEVATRTHWSLHLIFLLSLIIGGYIGAVYKGGFELQSTLGETHVALFGTGFAGFMTLLIGGMLVGFGTQFGGGCTSGHGLSGVSRLVPASLIATGSFFAAAILFSFAIRYLF